MADTLVKLEREYTRCRLCPRLVDWREEVALTKRASLREHTYWGRPVPSFGPANARLLIVGLAPGAHGANRTGRPFTGDGSGPLLYSALHAAGLSNRPLSEARNDGLVLERTRIVNAVRCVPPGNRPTPDEISTCLPYLVREMRMLRELRCVLCLGGIAWLAVLRACQDLGAQTPRPRPPFGHGSRADLGQDFPALIGSYHPSRLNTNTGRLTRAMFERVVRSAAKLARG